jgi:hypothetical protein
MDRYTSSRCRHFAGAWSRLALLSWLPGTLFADANVRSA